MRFRRKQVLCTNCGFLSWRFYWPEDGSTTKIVECWPIWRKRIQTNKDLGSLQDPETGEESNIFCSRGQWVFAPHTQSQERNYIDVEGLVQPRDCILYTKYEPSFSPEEHKELMRDDQTRKAVFKATLIGAIFGACAAIIVQILSILIITLSSP